MAQLTSAQRDTFASSSSSSASSSYTPYDVFINHRGPDVKNTFAGHIYHRLKSRGLQVFLDRPELQTGHNIHDQIKAAIEVASVHIAIFSENYAESKWCLEELVLMLNSRGTILPVFYNVKPFELRWTEKGAYAGALQKHEEQQRYDLPTIGEWKKALSHVADISGFELEACNGDEVELVDKVVQRVLKEVPKRPLHVAKYKIGLQEKLEEFERTVLSQLEEEGRLEAKVLGIHGSGGIGKSTLAKQFFNNKRSNYNVSSFLFDVRENATRKSIEFLQSKLLKDLKGINTQIESWEEGIGILENNLKSCHALIILDDVDHISQLDALILPIKHVLDPKSLILVTSRDKHVLQSSRMVESSIYRLKGLNRLHSSELFCWHAFFQRHPPPEFKDLVDRFVKACNGLPLSLQVFGALLCQENDRSYWVEQLTGLQKLPPDIQERLKISYDSLDKEEKQIFLDIACFSIGENKDKWITIWGWSGWKGSVGLRNLENKCLVEVSRANKIRMHDHLRDMGRDIAEDRSMPRRLWGATVKDVYDLLDQSSSSSDIEVRGIIMSPWSGIFTDTEKRNFRGKVFRISKLQLLEAKGDLVEDILSKVRSPNLNLIWLCLKNCPRSSLPSCIPVHDLRCLEVGGSKLKSLWQRKSLWNLWQRKSLWNLWQLTHLHLRDCSSWTISNKTLGNITTLECLDLSGCLQMKVLPLQVVQQRSLKKLNLLRTNIKELPSPPTVCLSKLEVLILGSPLLKVLPPWFGYLTSLKQLQLRGCKKLNHLSDSVGQLAQLEELDIAQCGIQYLPAAVMKMKNLKTLGVRDCPLRELPFKKTEDEEPSLLTELKEIHLHRTEISMVTFPEGVCPNLRELEITQCNGLLEVGALPTTLLHLHLRGCDALRKIGGLCGLVNLQDLDIRGCCALEVEELLGLETEISLDLLRRRKLRSLKKLKTGFQSYDSAEEKETTVLHGDFCNFFCRDSPIRGEGDDRRIRPSAHAVRAVYDFKKAIQLQSRPTGKKANSPNPAQQAGRPELVIGPSSSRPTPDFMPEGFLLKGEFFSAE